MTSPAKTAPRVPWSDDEAWRIVAAVDAWMRSNRPAGHAHTRQESKTLDALIARRWTAGSKGDMDGWRRVHLDLVSLCMESYRSDANGHARPPVRSRQRR